MAKKRDYHGFDQYKNVVEAPRVYLSNADAGLSINVGHQSVANDQGYSSLAFIKTTASSNPGTATGNLLSIRNQGDQVMQIFMDNSGDWYITGQKSGTYFTWKKLATVDAVDKVNISSKSITSASITAPDGEYMESGKVSAVSGMLSGTVGELSTGSKIVGMGVATDASTGFNIVIQADTNTPYLRTILSGSGKGYERLAKYSEVTSAISSATSSIDKVYIAELPYASPYIESPDVTFMPGGKISLCSGMTKGELGDLPSGAKIVEIGGRPMNGSDSSKQSYFGISIAVQPDTNSLYYRGLSNDASCGWTRVARATEIGSGSGGSGITESQATSLINNSLQNYATKTELEAEKTKRETDDSTLSSNISNLTSTLNTTKTTANSAASAIDGILESNNNVFQILKSSTQTTTCSAGGIKTVSHSFSAIKSRDTVIVNFNAKSGNDFLPVMVCRQECYDGGASLMFYNAGSASATITYKITVIGYRDKSDLGLS